MAAMKKYFLILLSVLVTYMLASCSKAEIRQAKVMTQSEIDAHNGDGGGSGGDEPGDDGNGGNNPGGDDSGSGIPALSNYYVSVEGAGKKDGSSVADAMDLTTFKDYVRKDTEDSAGKASRLDGVTFHFAAGTYTMWDAQHPEGLLLGFSDVSKQVKMTFEGASGTVFSGSRQYSILRLAGHIALQLKGITLSDAFSQTHGSAIYAADCSLTLKDCVLSDNKTSDSSDKNGNNGGAVYLAKDVTSASFTGCTFSNNRIESTVADQYGGAVRVESATNTNEVVFDNCNFTSNFAKQAACISVNANTVLKVNHCVFSENTANSRGMIQMAGGVVFINGSVFSGNHTAENDGWGVVLHGKGYVCMNNCTIYGNYNSVTTENKNVSVNGYHSLLMVNSTLVESCQLGLLRIDDNAGKQVLCNNILINLASGKSALVGNTTATTLSLGHNAMSGVSGFSSFAAHATDRTDCTQASFDGNKFESNVMSWNGPLAGFTAASVEEVEAAMTDSFDISLSGVMSNIGRKFHEWLSGMSPKGYAVDGRGVVRGAAFWPGAYQGEGQTPGHESLDDMGETVIH